jgi:hypothetical protein
MSTMVHCIVDINTNILRYHTTLYHKISHGLLFIDISPLTISSFLVRKALSGCQKLKPTVDCRLPITPTILHQLVQCLPHSFSDGYLVMLLSAMFLLAFHACLRVGEMTVCNPDKPQHAIHLKDVSVRSGSSSGSKALQIILKHCKGHTGEQPFTIVIPAHTSGSSTCPVRAVIQYLHARGQSTGPLFLFRNGLPVTGAFFRDRLRQCLLMIGLDPPHYKGHSFRIGAASTAAAAGLTDTQIQRLGRWSSDAFLRYIRSPSYASPELH